MQKEKYKLYDEFPGREMKSRLSRDERIFYLEKLRNKARRGDVQAMSELLHYEQAERIREKAEKILKERLKSEPVNTHGILS